MLLHRLVLSVLGLSAGLALAQPALTSKPLSALVIYPESRVVASVVADNEARLAAELSARIDSLPVRVGESVKKGAVLAVLDSRVFKLEAERARAQVDALQNRLKLADLQLSQAERLKDKQYVSQELLLQRQTEVAVLRAELRMAQQAVAAAELNVSKARISAPFHGVVTQRLAAVGELAAPGRELLVLVEQGQHEIRARVPVAQVADLRAGRELRLRLADRLLPVKIARISPVLERREQTQEVVLQSAQPLPSGTTGQLIWRSAQAMLPAIYVQRRGQELGAWVVEAGKPVFKAIPGAQAARPVAVNWPLQTLLVDQGRFGLGLPAPKAAPAAAQ